MSLYSEYVREHSDDEVIETEVGFGRYRFLNQTQVYIVDIYVRPDRRKSGAASAIADNIVELAKLRGCTELLGTVVPSAKNSTASLRVLLGYGMNLHAIEGNMVVFRKAI